MAITPLYTVAELDALITQWKTIERAVTLYGQYESTIDGSTRRYTARNLKEINDQLQLYQSRREALQSSRNVNAPQFLVGRPYRG
jgi:hypothetical protein